MISIIVILNRSAVILSNAKDLCVEMFRCAQHDELRIQHDGQSNGSLSAFRVLLCMLTLSALSTCRARSEGESHRLQQVEVFEKSTTESVGASQLRQVIALNKDRIPTNLKDLVTLIVERTHTEPVTAWIPMGRSLVRESTDLENPRVVIGFFPKTLDQQPSQDLAYQVEPLFIGFAKFPGIVEAISYNPVAGRFEFEVIENFGIKDQTPAFLRPSRELCLSCHTVGTPIFSGPQWKETANHNQELLSLLRKQIGTLQKRKVEERLFYEGFELPAEANDNTAENPAPGNTFEEASATAHKRLVANQLWQNSCGHSSNCRGSLIKFLLARQFKIQELDAQYFKSQEYKDAKKSFFDLHEQATGTRILTHLSPVFPSRDPLKNPKIDSSFEVIGLRYGAISLVKDDSSYGDIYGTYLLGSYFEDLLTANDLEKIKSTIRSFKEGTSFLEKFNLWAATLSKMNWATSKEPIDRCQILSEILSTKNIAGCPHLRLTPKTTIKENQSLELTKDPLYQKLNDYCGSCHGAGGTEPKFLDAKSTQEFQKKWRAVAKCVEKVLLKDEAGNFLMPPTSSPKYLKLKSALDDWRYLISSAQVSERERTSLDEKSERCRW